MRVVWGFLLTYLRWKSQNYSGLKYIGKIIGNCERHTMGYFLIIHVDEPSAQVWVLIFISFIQYLYKYFYISIFNIVSYFISESYHTSSVLDSLVVGILVICKAIALRSDPCYVHKTILYAILFVFSWMIFMQQFRTSLFRFFSIDIMYYMQHYYVTNNFLRKHTGDGGFFLVCSFANVILKSLQWLKDIILQDSSVMAF